MKSLVLIFIAHAVFRYPGDDVIAATVMCSFLAICMMGVARFGGWTSARDALAWLKTHPKIAFLVVGQATFIIVFGATNLGDIRLNHLFAYLIEGVFFSYSGLSAMLAFWQAGIASIASWVHRR